MVMGCYGIGITRTMAAAIEQNHDQDGIQWPVPIAPYEVCVLALNRDDEAVLSTADAVYEGLIAAGIEVVLDDRETRPGAKFKDADLIGFPYQIVVGKRGVSEGVVEVKTRKSGERTNYPIDEAAAAVADLVRAQRHPNV